MEERAIYDIHLRDNFTGPLGKMENKMDLFEGKLKGLGKTILGVFGGNLLAGGVEGFIQAVGDAVKNVISLGAEAQQTEIAFKTMLGSAERATQTIRDLRKFAEATPFSQREVIEGGKSLLAYTFTAEELTDRMRMLGDVSAGLGIPFGDLVYLFGTLKSQGRAYTKDIIQFAGRGIPIWEELSKVMGKTIAETMELVSEGKVGFDAVDQAFKNMTSSGGMFFNLMEEQANSLAGKWSAFQEKMEASATQLGVKMIPMLTKVVDTLMDIQDTLPKVDFSPLTDQFSELWDSLSGVYSIFGDLFRMIFGENLTTFELLTLAVRGLAFAFRVVTIPARGFWGVLNLIIKLVKDAVDIFKGLGNIIGGIFTRDISQIMKGVNQLESGVKKAFSEITQAVKKEADGWARIFAPIVDPSKMGGNPFAVGDTGPIKPDPWALAKSLLGNSQGKGSKAAAAKSSEAGVEKIKAGTRNITVNIGTIKLAETITSNKADLSDARIQDMLTRAMVMAVNDVNLVGQ